MRRISDGAAAGRSADTAPVLPGTIQEWASLTYPAYLPWTIWRSSIAIWTSLWLAPLGLRVEPMDRSG